MLFSLLLNKRMNIYFLECNLRLIKYLQFYNQNISDQIKYKNV